MKLAIIDLDGVIANVDARFERAKDVARALFAGRALVSKQEYDDVYWNAVFDSEQVRLDTLIEGVPDALDALRASHTLIFLTSRPEAMRDATFKWLYEASCITSVECVVHKPSALKFVKTVVWKAGMIQTLSTLISAQEAVFIDEVLVIDDEAANRAHLAQFSDTFSKLVIVESLAQAAAYVQTGSVPQGDLDDHPF